MKNSKKNIFYEENQIQDIMKNIIYFLGDYRYRVENFKRTLMNQTFQGK